MSLLETRVKGGALSPDEARHSINTVRTTVAARERRRRPGRPGRPAGRAGPGAGPAVRGPQGRAGASSSRRRASHQGEHGRRGRDPGAGQRLARRGEPVPRLLDEWKALPRIDRATDDALWHRFSAARTTYTRRRKAQFAEQAAKRDSAKAAKEQIIAEARDLANSTEWGPTAGAFRDLMTRWKAAGAAPRDVDDAAVGGVPRHPGRVLQRPHRRAERAGRRVPGEPGGQAGAAGRGRGDHPARSPTSPRHAPAFRTFLEKYNALGKVPREQIAEPRRSGEGARDGRPHGRGGRVAAHRPGGPRPRRGDGRHAVGRDRQAHREDRPRPTARGDQDAAAKATESIATYQTWLDQAKATLADFNR